MKLTCTQEQLKKGLAVASHALPSKATLPVLSHVLLATDGDRLTIAATDLEINIRHCIDATVEQTGAVTVPAKLLSDIVGGLPNTQITLTLDERTQTLNLHCARFECNLKGIEAAEFPILPTIATAPNAHIPSDILRSAIEQVAFAAAREETRPVLTGVLMTLHGNTATLVAADGFRLALRTIPLPEQLDNPVEVLVPARALHGLKGILSSSEPVALTLTPNANHLRFATPGSDVVARLIEGRFPDYTRIIPTQYATRTVLDTQVLSKAVKLAASVATSSANIVTSPLPLKWRGFLWPRLQWGDSCTEKLGTSHMPRVQGTTPQPSKR